MNNKIDIWKRRHLNTCVLKFLMSNSIDKEAVDKLIDLVKNESYRLDLPNVIQSLKDNDLIEKDIEQ
jgi:hypothetical protein